MVQDLKAQHCRKHCSYSEVPVSFPLTQKICERFCCSHQRPKEWRNTCNSQMVPGPNIFYINKRSVTKRMTNGDYEADTVYSTYFLGGRDYAHLGLYFHSCYVSPKTFLSPKMVVTFSSFPVFLRLFNSYFSQVPQEMLRFCVLCLVGFFLNINWVFTRNARCATNLVRECILTRTLAHFCKIQVCTV